jgi:chitin disaccharide deacetylase
MARRVILHADDFGLNEDATDATIACFDGGTLTSATIMANMPATARAAAYAGTHPEFSFGAHLVYVDERPICDAAKIPTLVTGDGRFLPTPELRKRAMLGRISVEDVARETEAQLGRLRDLGVPLSHVDSHGHTHKLAPIRHALEVVLPRFGIRRVRTAQNVFAEQSLFRATRWLGHYWDKRIRQHWCTTDDFYMTSHEHEVLSDRQLDAMLGGEGVLEAGFHPGTIESWRAAEKLAVERFREACRKRGVPLITWNDVGTA